MNNLYKIIILILLIVIVALLATTSYQANQKTITVCPTNAITMQNGKAVIDPIKCIGCGRCALGIPNPLTLTSSAQTQEKQVIDTSIPTPIAKIEPTVTSDKDPKVIKTVTKAIAKAIYKVQAELCIGCQLCVSNCPVNAITMIDGKAVIDQSKCTACGICTNGNGNDYLGCPVNAIKVTKN
jgi:ferredoxin